MVYLPAFTINLSPKCIGEYTIHGYYGICLVILYGFFLPWDENHNFHGDLGVFPDPMMSGGRFSTSILTGSGSTLVFGGFQRFIGPFRDGFFEIHQGNVKLIVKKNIFTQICIFMILYIYIYMYDTYLVSKHWNNSLRWHILKGAFSWMSNHQFITKRFGSAS